jgi:glutathione S-transferase
MIENEAGFLLYNAPGSTCSQRVRFVLAAKRLPYRVKNLDLFAGDQLQSDYLRINPNGVVPTLVHDGGVVVDSSVIIEYLDEKFPAPEPLAPADSLSRAAMRSLMRFIDEVPAASIRVPSFNIAFMRFFRDMSQADFEALADSKPIRRDFLLTMGRTGFPQAEMDSAMERLRRTVVRMDDAIAAGGGIWLLGNRMTLADVALMPSIVRMKDLGRADLWADHPRVGRWLEAIERHPAYAEAYSPGSHLSDRFPELKALHASK